MASTQSICVVVAFPYGRRLDFVHDLRPPPRSRLVSNARMRCAAPGALRRAPTHHCGAALDFMTRCDYLMVMKKVKIAQLKARLSEHLRQVRRGETYTVMDRETPIARLLPYGADAEPLRVRKPLRRVPTLQDVRLPPPLKTDVDPVALLLEERQVER